MSVAAVYRCCSLIAGTTASLSLGVYIDDPDRGRLPVPGKLARLLSVAPFPGRQMTAFSWKETLTVDLLISGNAYSIIRYDQAGRIAAFEYVSPRHVAVRRLNQQNVYQIQWPDGRPMETIPGDSMIHVAGLSLDGVIGMSKIRQNARNSIALARSIEEVQGKAFENSMSPRSVIKLPPGMSPDATKRLSAFMSNEFSGRSNVGKTLFLDAGSEFDALQISMVDLALLDARKASVTEICSWFGVPPTMLGQSDGVTAWGTGISALLVSFLKFSLNSELERIENEFRNKCTSGDQYIWFDRAELLQMDAESAATVATKEIACGISTVNEVRRRQHKPLVEGGEIALTNSTNIPLTEAIKPDRVAASQAATSPEPTP